MDEVTFSNQKSVDFEITLSALLATLATTVPNPIGGLNIIPISMAVGLLVLTLIRKMIVAADEEIELNWTMLLILPFSVISLTYIFFSFSTVLEGITPFAIETVDFMIGLTLGFVLEVFVFHILMPKDLLNYIYERFLYSKKNHTDSRFGKLLGRKMENLLEELFSLAPEDKVDEELQKELDIDFYQGDLKSPLHATVGVIAISTVAVVVSALVPYPALKHIAISALSSLLVIPFQLWYLLYGAAGHNQVMGKKFYLVWLIATIFIFVSMIWPDMYHIELLKGIL
jgi:hypothetical protein